MFYVLKVLRVFILALRATHKSGAKVVKNLHMSKKNDQKFTWRLVFRVFELHKAAVVSRIRC